MTIWQRIWPEELAMLQHNPKAIPMGAGPYERICANCGGMKIMMVFVIDGGPYPQPDGRKLKWLDLPEKASHPQTPTVSGWYSGELRAAPCPVCCKGQMAAYVLRNCGLVGAELNVSLANFRVDGALLAEKAAALAACKQLLGQGLAAAGFVTLVGAYGVGKSHLLKGLVNGFRQIGVMAKYSTMSDLLSDIRERFGEDHGAREAEAVIDLYRRARILAIDEVDRVNLTGWAKETIFRLLNSRYEESDRLLTVMATNVEPIDLPAELGYLGSRMNGGQIIRVGGPDMRPGVALRRETLTHAAASAQALEDTEPPQISSEAITAASEAIGALAQALNINTH